MLEQFRTLATELRDHELNLLDVRDREANASFLRTQNALGLATVVGLILTALAGVGAIRDVRRRQKAEAELYLEKERAQITLASIGDGHFPQSSRHGVDRLAGRRGGGQAASGTCSR